MKILVVGAGAWGQALAVHCAQLHKAVSLWGRRISQLLPSNDTSQVTSFAGATLKYPLTIEPDIKQACLDVTHVIIAVPSTAFREILQLLKKNGVNNAVFISAAKGLEINTGKFLSDIFLEEYPNEKRFIVLAGPSFANEVIAGMPTAIVLSCNDKKIVSTERTLLHHSNFRVYTNTDVIGTQLGAGLKNILAIAVAISDGLGNGANARAALITRGLAEIEKITLAMGGKIDTVYGLAGLGDLVLTATDDQSRNRRFGLYVGQGLSIKAAQEKVKQVVEGVSAVKAVQSILKDYHLELPIIQQVYEIVYQGVSPKEAVKNLINRQPFEETS